MDLVHELRTIVTSLEEQQVDYFLCGGLAMAVHGFARATLDIDLAIRHTDAGAAADIVRSLGYTAAARPMSVAAGSTEITRLTKVDPAGDYVSIDSLLLGESFGELWQSAERRQWQHGTIRVASRKGLIALKKLRGSPQDAADIANLTQGTE